MRSIDPATVPASETHRYLLSAVSPRPIAFVGTLDGEGVPNLAPFSFFNAFGANPPVIAVSPAFRGTDGSAKHTYLNIKETGEFTVSVVSYSMVQQMNLASADWPSGVNEFEAAGFTPRGSKVIAPAGVEESPVSFECRLHQHVGFGENPSAGNILIGEIVMMHLKDSVFTGKYPDYRKLDLVGRMGGPFYVRANDPAVFDLSKPHAPGIGFSALPSSIRESRVLTGNDLGILAGVQSLPEVESIDRLREQVESMELEVDDWALEAEGGDPLRMLRWIEQNRGTMSESTHLDRRHSAARSAIERGDVELAWRILLLDIPDA